MISYLIGALVGLAYILYSNQSKATVPGGGVQTSQVGDNLYTITRIAPGSYIIVLTSIKGSIDQFPASVVYVSGSVTQRMGDTIQLEKDIPRMNVDLS